MPKSDRPSLLKLGTWVSLFDASDMESGIAYFRSAIDDRLRGERATPELSIRRFVLDPAAAYFHEKFEEGVSKANVEASKQLVESAIRLIDAFDGTGAFDPIEAGNRVNELREKWVFFIVHAASPYVYSVLPKQQTQRENAPKGQRRDGWPQYICKSDVVAAERSCGGESAKAEAIISRLTEIAVAKVPHTKRPPGGSAEPAARRAYLDAVRTGAIARRARGRRKN